MAGILCPVSRYKIPAQPIVIRPVFAGILAGILAGCSPTPVAVCPSIVSYTQGEQTQAADELSALPAGSILPRFMTDYGVLRAKLRECQ
jgi:cytochrome c biogenesis protein CcdA